MLTVHGRVSVIPNYTQTARQEAIYNLIFILMQSKPFWTIKRQKKLFLEDHSKWNTQKHGCNKM